MTVCSRCGASNRPNARFCTRCGAAIVPGASAAPAVSAPAAQSRPLQTVKVCPRCQARNTLGERTCHQCGYAFTTFVPPTGGTPGRRRFFWLVATMGSIAVITLLALGASQVLMRRQVVTAAARTDDAAPLENAAQATVQILTPDDSQSGSYSAGSGSVVDARGYILTNFHVIGDTASGQLYNKRGEILVGVAPQGSTDPPQLLYRARLVEADRDLDLALLRIDARSDGASLPADLGLGVLPVGDSDRMQIGDDITVLGYPGIGGDTLTLTRGSVAGFLPGWIKTDAETNHGNSGGAAINAAGELVGVPTAGSSEAGDSEHLPGKIGLIRPINLAQSLLEKIGR